MNEDIKNHFDSTKEDLPQYSAQTCSYLIEGYCLKDLQQ